MSLGAVAATGVASRGGFDPGFQAAGSSTRNVAGERKLARHAFGVWLTTTLRFPGDHAAEILSNMANLINRRQFTIEWGHCDPAGIVFNARFSSSSIGAPGRCSSWRWASSRRSSESVRHRRHSAGRCRRALSGSGEVRRRGGDRLASSEFRRSSFDVTHRIFVGDAVAVEGSETRVWAVRDPADPGKIRSQPIPPEVTARFVTD